MPRDGSGVYSTPPGTHGTPNTTILSANYNSNVDDVAVDLNTPRPIVAGGTGATTAAGALTALGAVAKAGDTMTGDLTIGKSTPTFTLNNTGAVQTLFAFSRNGSKRWQIVNNNDPESGGNVGSSLLISRYNDAGIYIDSPVNLDRAIGKLTVSGALFVDGTVTPTPGVWAQRVIYKGSNLQYGIGFFPVADNNAPHAIEFYNAATSLIGTISTSSTATAYNTSSDDRLKTDLQEFDAGRIVDNTQVYSFVWKSTGERSYGVSAQQANEVYPEAVTHTEETDWWGIDYSKYVPVLLQELKSLRARVAALEGGGLSGKPT